MARDLLADAMLRVERAGFPPILTVHDEVVCEVGGSTTEYGMDEFMELMQIVPSWAKGLPLKAEGWVGRRYRK